MLAMNFANVLCIVMFCSTTMPPVSLGAFVLRAEAFSALNPMQSLAATLTSAPLCSRLMLGSEPLMVCAMDACVGFPVGVHDTSSRFARVALMLYMPTVPALFGFVINFPGICSALGLVAQVHFRFVDAPSRTVVPRVMFMVLHGSCLP
jgi:hypothetical protein